MIGPFKDASRLHAVHRTETCQPAFWLLGDRASLKQSGSENALDVAVAFYIQLQ